MYVRFVCLIKILLNQLLFAEVSRNVAYVSYLVSYLVIIVGRQVRDSFPGFNFQQSQEKKNIIKTKFPLKILHTKWLIKLINPPSIDVMLYKPNGKENSLNSDSYSIDMYREKGMMQMLQVNKVYCSDSMFT